MKEGGKIAARILKLVSKAAKPGITTKKLDGIAALEIRKAGARASFLGHAGFPSSICTSVNSEIVHGIPLKRMLKDGDILGIDLGIKWKKYHTDTAATIGIGEIDFAKRQLIQITKKALEEAIKKIKPGIHLGDVQNHLQNIIESAGYSVIRDLSGHGIGKNLQESPTIPNFGRKGTGPVLKEGMVLAIEPMVSAGDWHVKISKDGWTVILIDGSLGAHFEHTVALTKHGCEVLTF